MRATISKEIHFSASHFLVGLADDHPCSRVHGHNYIARIELSGQVDEIGFVVDYRRLDRIKAIIDEQWDHRHLNDVVSVNPTAENLANALSGIVLVELATMPDVWSRLSRIAVAVSETPKTWATVEVLP